MPTHTVVKVAGLAARLTLGGYGSTLRAQVLTGGRRTNLRWGGDGRVTGVVRTKGSPTNPPVRSLVRLYRDFDGAFVAQAWSDANTGAYAFNWIAMGYRYTAIAYHTERQLRAAAADNLTPERIPA